MIAKYNHCRGRNDPESVCVWGGGSKSVLKNGEVQVSEVDWKEGDKLQERPENGGQALKKKKRKKVIWLQSLPSYLLGQLKICCFLAAIQLSLNVCQKVEDLHPLYPDSYAPALGFSSFFLIVISNVSLVFFNNYLDFKVVRRQETVPGFYKQEL